MDIQIKLKDGTIATTITPFFEKALVETMEAYRNLTTHEALAEVGFTSRSLKISATKDQLAKCFIPEERWGQPCEVVGHAFASDGLVFQIRFKNLNNAWYIRPDLLAEI